MITLILQSISIKITSYYRNGSFLRVKMSKSSSGTPPTVGTLPPRVSGPTRYILKVKCYKIIWNQTPLPSKSASSSENRTAPFVKLKWWGETGEGVNLYPSNVGLSLNPSSKTRNSASYAVKCQKKQLSSYFSDMGSLPFEIWWDDRVLGIASITDFSTLAKERPRPLNGFFPILDAAVMGSQSALSSNVSKTLGELQVILELNELDSGKTPGAVDPQSETKNAKLKKSPKTKVL
jgi:hypothetical protein